MRKETCKSVGKKVLASALSAAMVVAFAPAASVTVVGAVASDAVAFADEGNDTIANQLPAADKGVITLKNDVTISEWPTEAFYDNKLTFEMNGHTIFYTGNTNESIWTLGTNSGKTLTFNDGTIKALEKGKTLDGTIALFSIQRGCTLNLNNMEVTATSSVLWPNGDAAAVNVRNSTINAGVYAVATNAKSPDNYKVTISLENSTFNTYYGYKNYDGDACPVCINVPCNLKMTGCEVNGTRQGVMVRGGDATIIDSKINLRETKSLFSDGGGCDLASSNKDKYLSSDWGGGNEIPMAALVVGNRHAESYKYPATLVLCNTQVNAADGYTKVYTYGMEEPDASKSNCDSAKLKADVLSDLSAEDVKGTSEANNKAQVVLDAAIGGITAQTGETKYYTPTGAAHFARSGETIKLVNDAIGNIGVSKDKSIALDLNGKKLVVPVDCGIDVKGKLAVSDSAGNGIITCDATPVCSEGSGIFTLNSGTIKSTGDYGIYCKDGGTAVVNDGVVTSKDAALSGNNTTGDMNFEINGGTLTASQGPAIYMPGQVKLTITDGVLNGGISLRMGQVDISGGTINAITSGIDSPASYYNYSGNAWLPDALYVFGGTYTSANAQYGNSLNLNITGGTFNCANDEGSAVAIYDLGKVAQEANVNISGDAKFVTKSASRSAYQVLTFSDIGVDEPVTGYNNPSYVGKVKSSISAGAFSSDPDSSYKAAGTETHLSTTDKMYHVHAQNADVRSDSAKAPTCTEPGYTADSYCGIDGYVYSSGSTIPALGHEAGEYVVTTPATETSEGVATSTCTRCGEVLGTKTIEKLKPAGTEESGMSDTGEKVDVTVSDNTPGKTESGTEYVGSVEFNGTDSGSTGQPSSEASIPETVEVNGSTYVVTKIADEAFKDQEQLKNISIPATVVEVGKSAFEGTGIQSINIPAATSSIGVSAFKGCADLKTINIQSAALKEIPASAFEGCASLQTANVPATIEKVGAKAFAGTAISDVVLPEATTEVGASAFKNCESLKTVEFKGGVTVISDSLFQGAKALEAIELPTSVTTVGKSAFEGTALKSLALPAAVKSVGSKAFASTPITSIVPAAKTTMAVAASGDGTLVLPAGLTTLGTSAFAGCASLKTATLPTKVKALAASTFSGCTALKSVDISGATTIGKSAFAGDKALKSLKTGTKLTAIGSSALSGAKALKTLNVSTKKLTKKGVKSSLKGSSVKAVKVKASKSKKTNKKYIAKYKKYFAKKNSGKKVTVK